MGARKREYEPKHYARDGARAHTSGSTAASRAVNVPGPGCWSSGNAERSSGGHGCIDYNRSESPIVARRSSRDVIDSTNQ